MFALLIIPTRNSFVEILEDEMSMAQKLTVVVATFHDFESWAETQDWSALHV
jgi:hypothetical protein